MNKPEMTQQERSHAGLYTTYTIPAHQCDGIKNHTAKLLESQARELQATVPEIMVSWLNEMADLHR
jgi:hypothetical protein